MVAYCENQLQATNSHHGRDFELYNVQRWGMYEYWYQSIKHKIL